MKLKNINCSIIIIIKLKIITYSLFDFKISYYKKANNL